MSKKNHTPEASLAVFYIVLAIVAFVFVSRFWNLASPDISSGDDALYSFRALGWLDYLGGGQTAPIQWFERVPWWGALSFHDAPPLVFAIQHLFFSVLGPTVFAARLPFALAGALLVWVFYAMFKKFKGEKWALVAAIFLAASTNATWLSRIGFLEGVEVLFILLGFFLFLRWQQEQNAQNALLFGVALGLALLSKYTAVFMVFAVCAYILIWQRGALKKKSTWLSVAALLFVLAPVIIYNAEVYRTRGHFDAGLSAMVGMHPQDFQIIAARTISANYLANFTALFSAFPHVNSWPFYVLMLISFIYLCVQVIRKKGGEFERFLLTTILSGVFMFLFLPVDDKYLTMIIPFLIAAAVIFVFDAVRFFRERNLMFGRIAVGIFAAMVGFEVFYNTNTHLLATPIGTSPVFYSGRHDDVTRSYGFNQLDEYLQEKVFVELPQLKRPMTLAEMNTVDPDSIRGKNIVFFDETMQWSAYVWYLEKYSAYYRLPVISLTNYMQTVPQKTDLFAPLKQTGAKGMYYFFGASDAVVDGIKKQNANVRGAEISFAGYLEKNGKLIDEIKNNKGDVAFKVFYVELNPQSGKQDLSGASSK